MKGLIPTPELKRSEKLVTPLHSSSIDHTRKLHDCVDKACSWSSGQRTWLEKERFEFDVY